jgi:hypothetical protein
MANFLDEIPWPLFLIATAIFSFIAYILTQVVCLCLWLKDGIWYSSSCLSVIQLANPDLIWLFHPDSWIGFHHLLGFVNAGVGLVFFIHLPFHSIMLLEALKEKS